MGPGGVSAQAPLGVNTPRAKVSQPVRASAQLPAAPAITKR